MYPLRSRPHLGLNTTIKHEINNVHSIDGSGALSPDVHPRTQLPFSDVEKPALKKLGKYLISGLPDASLSGSLFVCNATDLGSGATVVCKVLPASKYKEVLSPYWVAGQHRHINSIREVIVGKDHAYIFFDSSYEDLHTYVRKHRKLREDEACRLFTQIVSAVQHCHENGVILRDLKLRKFVFKDAKCSHLVLDSLEDSYVLPNPEDDLLTDRHGCPAYVSPEILFSSGGYSGKSADIWSLGVVLYTMLAGQYPFHDVDVGSLFKKIRQGVFLVPEGSSTQARCLLKNLLRTDPSERLLTDEILSHSWFSDRSTARLSPCPRRPLRYSSVTAGTAASIAPYPGNNSSAGLSLLAGNSSSLEESNSSSPGLVIADNVQKFPHCTPDQTVPQINVFDRNDFGTRFPTDLSSL